MYLLGWILLATDAPSAYSVYASFVGWLFMLCNIGGIVLSTMVPNRLRYPAAAPTRTY